MDSVKMLIGYSLFYGVAVIASGLYRVLAEPGGETGLWFGLVMGSLLLLSTLLFKKFRYLAALSLLIVTLMVGGWFVFENFFENKHQIRMYVIIILSVIEIAVVTVWLLGPKTGSGIKGPSQSEAEGSGSSS